MELLGKLQGGKDDFEDTLSNCVPSTSFEVSDGFDDLLLHFCAASIAGLELSQMVLLGHSIDEASQKVVDHVDIDVRFVCESGLLWLTNQSNCNVTKGFSSLEVLLSCHISLHLLYFISHCLSVAKVIQSNGFS